MFIVNLYPKFDVIKNIIKKDLINNESIHLLKCISTKGYYDKSRFWQISMKHSSTVIMIPKNDNDPLLEDR